MWQGYITSAASEDPMSPPWKQTRKYVWQTPYVSKGIQTSDFSQLCRYLCTVEAIFKQHIKYTCISDTSTRLNSTYNLFTNLYYGPKFHWDPLYIGTYSERSCLRCVKMSKTKMQIIHIYLFGNHFKYF